jgi:DeoR family transcriptional regulator of aga operon
MTDPAIRLEGAGERREWICAALREVGFVPIVELARDLGVSQMTIRRDLHALEAAGQIRIFHGGAGLTPGAAQHSPFPDDDGGASQRVGAFAAGLVDAADTIVLDAGPTSYALARAIPAEFAGCVITHSMPVLQHFDERGTAARAVSLGGELLAGRHAFVGPTTEAAVAGLRARTFFFAPWAVDARGMYARSAVEASLQRRLLDVADHVVLLATSQTFTNSAPALVAPLDRLTAVVAGGRPPAEIAAALRKLGVVPHVVAC